MYEVEIQGGDRDPPPCYQHEGVDGLVARIGRYVRQALEEQRADGQPRSLVIRLPAPRASKPRKPRRRRHPAALPSVPYGALQRAYAALLPDEQTPPPGGEEGNTHHGQHLRSPDSPEVGDGPPPHGQRW